MSSAPTNVLSFDVEHWYSATLVRDSVSDPTDHLTESVESVLSILADYDVQATFFVVGQVAERYPELIARIDRAGHEIGSHGHTHQPLFDLSKASFREEIAASTAAIRTATGTQPIGFRAPNFSVTPKTRWAIEVLNEAGYRYDSSVFPVRTPMYGVNGVPLEPYRLDPARPFEQGTVNSPLVELPLAVAHPKLRVPIAGGFYARLLPRRLLVAGIRRLNARGIPATLYFHPWEFNPAVTTDEPGLHKRFVSFHGIDGLSATLRTLLETFSFTTAASVARAQPGGQSDTAEGDQTITNARRTE
ncbi:polysaccharide deacetylase family protein [Halocatena halophila]|uniref:polysaccharide deacetylase family protein n=1 Tax=Halocatena halophila TaxID=2814576 RepID=UPI002ED47003